MKEIPNPSAHADVLRAAPYVGRLLVAANDEDGFAAQAAIDDAAEAGFDVSFLTGIIAQALVRRLENESPTWPDDVRAGLIDGALGL